MKTNIHGEAVKEVVESCTLHFPLILSISLQCAIMYLVDTWLVEAYLVHTPTVYILHDAMHMSSKFIRNNRSYHGLAAIQEP